MRMKGMTYTMKIIYDISVLGLGYRIARAKTGVYRVVEHIMDSLVDEVDCDVLFSAIQGNSFHCTQYLQSNHKLYNSTLIAPENWLFSLNTRGYKYKWFLFQMINRFRTLLLHSSEQLYPQDLFSQALLHTTQIFHSPFFPIPEQIRQTSHIKRFITIYDLIPVLFPQFFKFREDRFIKNILTSIDSETRVLCISHSTRNDLCSYKKELDPEKVFITHLAASDHFYPCHEIDLNASVRKKYAIPDGEYILSLGTLEPRKNIAHTIRCFARLVSQEHIPDLHLVLVGTKGWDYQHIFKTISGYGFLKDRIILTDFVPDEDLAPLYSGALMFVYPSFYEGFGLPPLEAMQCGVPVITSNTSSLPEVVGGAGIMVSPTDEESLCQEMLSIYRDNALRNSMSFQSLEQAKRFSWKKCAAETIAAYRSALDN